MGTRPACGLKGMPAPSRPGAGRRRGAQPATTGAIHEDLFAKREDLSLAGVVLELGYGERSAASARGMWGVGGGSRREGRAGVGARNGQSTAALVCAVSEDLLA